VPNVGGTVGGVVEGVTGAVSGATGGGSGGGSGGATGGGSGAAGALGSVGTSVGASGLGLGSASGAGSTGGAAASSGRESSAAAVVPPASALPAGTQPARATKLVVKNTGDKRKRRSAVIRFTLPKPAVVRFGIWRVAPDCTYVGRVAVRGHKGQNRFRFNGRFRGEPLPPGTYALRAVARLNGRYVWLGTVKVVIVPAGAGAESARPQASSCPTDGRGVPTGATTAAAGNGEGSGSDSGADETGASASGTSAGGGNGSGGGNGAGTASGVASGPSAAGDADGAVFGVVPNPFEDAPGWLQPLLLAALALALLLLLVAALPRGAVRPGSAALAVSDRRMSFALGGALILGTVTILALVL
jgi:hypothetical protein